MGTTIATGLENVVGKTSTATQTQTTQAKILGKDDFMKLLLAQMKNQDPLNPMDGTDFTAQLAQFSSLEQLSNLNTEIKAQSVNQLTLGYAQSVNMIGKEVVANAGNTVTANGQTVNLNYNLSKAAQTVTIGIFDKNGKLVKTWDETGQKAGMNKATWDCSGIEKGDYTYQISAKDELGKAVSAETMTTGVVTAVHFRNNQILVTVNGLEMPLGSIIEVKQAENPSTTG